jgi:hypothetical protein
MNHEHKSTAWPLLFNHRGTILGKGFLAEVELQGRLLATPEVEGIWLDGVNPGSLALGASNLAEANAELQNTLTLLLIDFAEEAPTFDAFKANVEHFFNDTDTDSEREWNAAVECVRAGAVNGPEGLPRHRAESERIVKVTQKAVEAVTPKDNMIGRQPIGSELAAAA